jgi:hypothetical protein
MTTVRDAANTPQEMKRSRDRVHYANMSDEAKKEKIIKKNLNRSVARGGVIASLRNRLFEPGFSLSQRCIVCSLYRFELVIL